jgi:hypothetical protein
MALKVLGPDSVYADEVAFSTTSTTRFFTGTINTDTADLEVSIRGGGFSTDPSLISFSASGWIVPNPTAYPNGLELFSGENTIEVRSIPLSGTPSAPVLATAFLLASSTVSSIESPTAITVERFDSSVNVSVQGMSDPDITGYNFYASAFAGGGTVGYSRINAISVTVPVTKESTVSLFNLTSKNVAQGADPLFVRALITQEDSTQATLETDVNSAVQIPETVTEVQVDISISSLELIEYFEFLHNRKYNLTSVPSTIPVGAFAVLPSTEPLYYVATAVYFDPLTQIEYESSFSQEVVANPINIRVSTQSLPSVSRQQILQNAVASIYRKDKDIAVQPGAVVRDTVLDPFSTEAERIRFLLDFIYRASSFDTLLEIDDPSGSGVSLAPASSNYKIALSKALYLSDPALVQTVIDGAFDKLAANFGVTRTPGQRAIGEARFYTGTTPTTTLQAQLGTLLSGGGVSFRSSRIAEIPLSRLASFYNPSTGQYSITVPAQAVNPGSSGNIGARQISSGAPFGLSVINDNEFFGGTNAQTNAQLAAESRGALSAVDTGTQRGYFQTAAKVPGLIQAQVVEAGNPLMQRDYDVASATHIGGKVDVWSQGQRLATVTDSFAFTFVRKRDVQFVVVGDPSAYQFQALDSDLSATNPLSQMLDYSAIGLGLRNATTSMVYNLSGVTYLNYNTIALSLDVPQPVGLPTLTDVILGDYRYRTGEKFVLTRQPVESITQVVGEASGTLDASTWTLVHPNSPLALGRSTQAGDYLQITGSADPALSVPTGAILSVVDEEHVIVGDYTEYVLHLGADSMTIVVKNADGTVTYNNPFTSVSPDYSIADGDQTNPLGIKRTSGSAITDGQTILISYSYDENFVITYQTNLITSALQTALDGSKHGAADVLAKGGIPVPVDLTATCVLKKGFQQSTVDATLRTNLGLLLSRLRMGSPLRRSDVVNVLDSSSGVSYVVLPLTTLVRAFGSTVAKDDLASGQIGDTVRLDQWSDAVVSTWLITQELTAATTTGGGPTGSFVGVFEDDVQLTLQLTLPEQLQEAAGRTYIIGAEGVVIPAYSDDNTLISQGYVTPAEIAARRVAITQNRVMVSLPVGDAPSNHAYWATYIVGLETGERDIDPTGVEYLTPGVWTFSFSEDRA